MSANGETHAKRMQEGGGLGASQHAPGGKTRVKATGNGLSKKNKDSISLTELGGDLTAVLGGLEGEGVESPWMGVLRELAARVSHASHMEEARPSAIEERLRAIEDTLKKAVQSPATGKRTWATVAASHTQAGQTHATSTRPPTERHTVRVAMPNTKERSGEEILREVKRTIPGAAAVRVLQSGDVDVTVPDEAAKERAQGVITTPELKVYKQDYMVEVLGVPIRTQVAPGTRADNSILAVSICEASKALSPGLRITRIQWLYSQPQLERLRAAGKQRGSLLVGLQTQEMRRQVLRGGLVIGAELFEVRQFEKALQETQCFKCQKWGHTQHACARQARCARCAGPHGTKECTRDEGEIPTCANCGKHHKAWQRSKCDSFQTYHETVQRRRVDLLAHAYSVRAARESRPDSEGWTRVGGKRPREESSPAEPAQRRIGRPTGIERAAKDPTQGRIAFACGSQPSNVQPSPMDLTGSDE